MNIQLTDGATRVVLAPQRGGAVMLYQTRFEERVYDWMVPGNPQQPSCFAMLPWCSRIRNGHFRFQGRSLQLPANNAPEPHSIHGHGWQRPWQPVDVDTTSALLEYEHTPDAWPWRYQARQMIELRGQALAFTLSLENRSAQDMPAGMGLHPYFSVTPGAVLDTAVTHCWVFDEQLRQMEQRELPPSRTLSAFPVTGAGVDNVYSGWQRELQLTLPQWRAQVSISASALFSHLILYTGGGQEFVCAEPVSNVANGFNLAPATDPAGLYQVIAPGATLTGSVLISPRLLRTQAGEISA